MKGTRLCPYRPVLKKRARRCTSWLVIQGATSAGAKAILEFDQKSGLLVAFSQTKFRDYREVNGVLYPFAVTARPGTEVRFEKMEDGPVTVDAAEFEIPSSGQKRLVVPVWSC